MPSTVKQIQLKPNQKAERKLFATFVLIPKEISGETTDKLELLGAGVEESVVESNPDTETVTDIIGITEETINKFEEAQAFTPNTLRGGQYLNAWLLDMYRRRATSEFAQFSVVRAWALLSEGTEIEAGEIEAEMDINCTIVPQSVGGSSFVDMPMNVTYSGDRKFGTVDKMANGAVFTAASGL